MTSFLALLFGDAAWLGQDIEVESGHAGENAAAFMSEQEIRNEQRRHKVRPD